MTYCVETITEFNCRRHFSNSIRVLLLLGGTEGGLLNADAKIIFGHGFVVMALAYFGTDPLPKELNQISLEYIRHNAEILKFHPEVDASKVFINISGPIMLVSGTDDQVWPSSTMANLAMERLRKKGFAQMAEHLKYEGAGHFIGLPAWPTSGRIFNSMIFRPSWMLSFRVFPHSLNLPTEPPPFLLRRKILIRPHENDANFS